ncbi:MAG: molecular chaperone Tir [Lachnospiraceae bacterium]|jgi:hypothetical protein|nr:molecular chaperone Tir [Lachnospiraceae bacterium]
MVYRTKTYIAGDWDGDSDAITQLYKWKESNYWSFDFVNAHDITQSKDSSLNCSIKKSLTTRLDSSKTFVLIVGNQTNSRRAGRCSSCSHYVKNYFYGYYVCEKNITMSDKSYIDYECDYAIRNNLKIIVLYNSSRREYSWCPESIKNIGKHVPMTSHGSDGKEYWDYKAVKEAFE